jgi:hypothetical protein
VNTDSPSSAESDLLSDLRGPRPRKSRLSRNGMLAATGCVLLWVFSIVSGYLTATNARHEIETRERLRTRGSETSGRIVRTARYLVFYQFEANGQTFAGQAHMPDRIRGSLRESDPFPIRYLPSDPALNHPAGWEDSETSAWEPVIASLIAVALGVTIGLSIWSNRTLVSRGIAVVGVVTKCGGPLSRGGFQLRYDFRTEDGNELKGRGWCETRQEVGTSVRVLYLPTHPKRNLPYPSPYYSIDR